MNQRIAHITHIVGSHRCEYDVVRVEGHVELHSPQVGNRKIAGAGNAHAWARKLTPQFVWQQQPFAHMAKWLR